MIRERGDAIIAALADGVGASREGGAAARRAVEMLADYCLTRPTGVERAARPRGIHRADQPPAPPESIERHGPAELACTMSAVVLEGGRLYGCNVGDSPVFHWRRGRVQRLSQAHTLDQPGLGHVLTQGARPRSRR